MKANEFVKKFGWDAAKHKADELKIIESMGDKLSFEDESLKRLVESHELVGKLGGYKRAERILKKSYKGWSNSVSVVWNDKPFQCSIQELKQAIADVESCQ